MTSGLGCSLRREGEVEEGKKGTVAEAAIPFLVIYFFFGGGLAFSHRFFVKADQGGVDPRKGDVCVIDVALGISDYGAVILVDGFP